MVFCGDRMPTTSTSSPTLTMPDSMRPVTTVPRPCRPAAPALPAAWAPPWLQQVCVTTPRHSAPRRPATTAVQPVCLQCWRKARSGAATVARTRPVCSWGRQRRQAGITQPMLVTRPPAPSSLPSPRAARASWPRGRPPARSPRPSLRCAPRAASRVSVRVARLDGEHVFDRHCERPVQRACGVHKVCVHRVHELQHGVAAELGVLALQRSQRGPAHDRHVVAREPAGAPPGARARATWRCRAAGHGWGAASATVHPSSETPEKQENKSGKSATLTATPVQNGCTAGRQRLATHIVVNPHEPRRAQRGPALGARRATAAPSASAPAPMPKGPTRACKRLSSSHSPNEGASVIAPVLAPKSLRAGGALVEGEQLAQLHLHQLHQLLILHRVDLVQEAHNARHAHLRGRPGAAGRVSGLTRPSLRVPVALKRVIRCNGAAACVQAYEACMGARWQGDAVRSWYAGFLEVCASTVRVGLAAYQLAAQASSRRVMLGRQRLLTQSPHQCRGPGCGVCAIQVIRACRASRMCSRVCGIGPSVADTTRIAPSICPRPAQSARARLSAQRLVSTALGWYKGALRAVCAPGSNMHAPGHPAPGAAAAPGKDGLCRGGTWGFVRPLLLNGLLHCLRLAGRLGAEQPCVWVCVTARRRGPGAPGRRP